MPNFDWQELLFAQLQNQNTTNYRENVVAAGEVRVVRKPHFLIFAREAALRDCSS